MGQGQRPVSRGGRDGFGVFAEFHGRGTAYASQSSGDPEWRGRYWRTAKEEGGPGYEFGFETKDPQVGINDYLWRTSQNTPSDYLHKRGIARVMVQSSDSFLRLLKCLFGKLEFELVLGQPIDCVRNTQTDRTTTTINQTDWS